jgi:hypothetical protein
MMTQREKQKLIRDAASIFVAAGGIVTLAFAIYFIVDLIKKWYS